MIDHPLVRCGLFGVLFFLLIVLGGGFVHSMVSGVIVNCLGVVLATAGMLALDRRGVGYIGLSPERGWYQQILGGAALGFGMVATIAVAMLASGHLSWQARTVEPVRWISLAGLFAGAATFEELLFRGYGFQRLVEGIGRVPALLALSVLFAAGHRNNPHATWPGLINTVLVGLVFGFAYLRTQQLWLPIAWHWSWNLTEAMLGFPVSGLRFPAAPVTAVTSGHPLWTGGAYGPEAGLPATFVLFAGLILVLRWRQVQSRAS